MQVTRLRGASTLKLSLILVAAVLAAVALTLMAAERPAEAAFAGKNGRIAFGHIFTTVENDDPEIYTILPDGSGLHQVTRNSRTLDGAPAWSPGGTKIAFSRQTPWNQIFVKDTRTEEVAQLTHEQRDSAYPAWSPDGTKIAFSVDSGSGLGDIWVMNADGSGQRNLTPGLDGVEDAYPAWSPDATKIAFSSNRANPGFAYTEIYTMNASDGSGVKKLTGNQTATQNQNTVPAWSPDATKIAFLGYRNNETDIYTMNADGTNQKNITSTTARAVGFPAWSPNGKKIAFMAQPENGAYDIYTMNTDGTNQKNVTNTPLADENDPDWQPLPVTPQ